MTLVLFGCELLALGYGFWLGYILGRNRRMSPSEASKVLSTRRGRRGAITIQTTAEGVEIL